MGPWSNRNGPSHVLDTLPCQFCLLHRHQPCWDTHFCHPEDHPCGMENADHPSSRDGHSLCLSCWANEHPFRFGSVYSILLGRPSCTVQISTPLGFHLYHDLFCHERCFSLCPYGP